MPNHRRNAAGRASALKKSRPTPQSSSSVQSSPMTIDAIIDSVIELKEKLQFEDCIKILDKGIKKFSSATRIFELLFLMGEVYLEMGDPLNSQHFLKQAIQGMSLIFKISTNSEPILNS